MSQSADRRPSTVNRELTLNGPDRSAPTKRAERRPRRRSEVENDDFARFAVRIIRAHGRRIAEGDVDGLADLLALTAELDVATQVAVDGLRGRGYSWGEIASRLGTSRQNAQQRWSK
jgi:hypothetical protein